MTRQSQCHGCGTTIVQTSSKGRARKWCSERCRKNSYDLECVVCGGRVNGWTPGKMRDRNNPVCAKCSPDYYRIWNKDAIVCAIQEWADENGGIPPTAPDWNPTMAAALGLSEKVKKFREDGCWPNVSVVQSYFGSWNEAIRAAGFDPRPPGHYGRPGEDPEEVARTVRLYVDEHLSAAKVAAILGVHPVTVLARLQKAGVPRRKRSDYFRREAA